MTGRFPGGFSALCLGDSPASGSPTLAGRSTPCRAGGERKGARLAVKKEAGQYPVIGVHRGYSSLQLVPRAHRGSATGTTRGHEGRARRHLPTIHEVGHVLDVPHVRNTAQRGRWVHVAMSCEVAFPKLPIPVGVD